MIIDRISILNIPGIKAIPIGADAIEYEISDEKLTLKMMVTFSNSSVDLSIWDGEGDIISGIGVNNVGKILYDFEDNDDVGEVRWMSMYPCGIAGHGDGEYAVSVNLFPKIRLDIMRYGELKQVYEDYYDQRKRKIIL